MIIYLILGIKEEKPIIMQSSIDDLSKPQGNNMSELERARTICDMTSDDKQIKEIRMERI